MLQVAWRLLACVLLGLIVYHGYLLVDRLSSQPLTSVPVSKGFMFAAVPLGCLFVLAYELRRIAYQLRFLRTGSDPAGEHSISPRTDYLVRSHEDRSQ